MPAAVEPSAKKAFAASRQAPLVRMWGRGGAAGGEVRNRSFGVFVSGTRLGYTLFRIGNAHERCFIEFEGQFWRWLARCAPNSSRVGVYCESDRGAKSLGFEMVIGFAHSQPQSEGVSSRRRERPAVGIGPRL